AASSCAPSGSWTRSCARSGNWTRRNNWCSRWAGAESKVLRPARPPPQGCSCGLLGSPRCSGRVATLRVFLVLFLVFVLVLVLLLFVQREGVRERERLRAQRRPPRSPCSRCRRRRDRLPRGPARYSGRVATLLEKKDPKPGRRGG